MTEPEIQTEEEIATMSEFVGEVTTDTIDTDVTSAVATIETDNAMKYESTEHEDVEPNMDRDKRGKKKKSWRKRCRDTWTCEGESLWRIYMKSYAESLVRENGRKISSDVARLPGAKAELDETFPLHECFPLGGFQLEHRVRTPVLDRCQKMRIWRSMRTGQSKNVSRRREKLLRTESVRWPDVWPCATQDLASKLKMREKKERKRRDVFLSDSQENDKEKLVCEQRSYFANRKELDHVRVPIKCPKLKVASSEDRSTGKRPGLVDGDYVIVELASEEQDKCVYANVVLRGLKGMHLPELSSLRKRTDTWKFCFYQAIVALLAKTQLRYKYAWSANIDYIYDHAWTLYTHIGTINVKEQQRLDDIVVYNYKYSVEIELLQELKDVPMARNIDFDYEESGLRRRITLHRKDPLRVKVELGFQKMTDLRYVPVHENTQKIEEWFDELSGRYRNCIFRTTRFSLAFWEGGQFWYLYNPYRCDEFGLWDDDGYACIVKFCSKDSLRKHLMILLLRAYAYKVPGFRDSNGSQIGRDDDVFDIQIFHVNFHRCQLYNLKLLQRGAPKLPRCVDKYQSECLEVGDDQNASDVEETEDDPKKDPRREKATWLKRLRITWWSRYASTSRRRQVLAKWSEARFDKAKWHRYYYVEEVNRLFSLWGEIHITDGMFDEANRGMQTYACYVVCAGMTRIIAPEYWNPKILDVIVMCGDRYYTHSKLEAEFKSIKSEHAHVNCWSSLYLSDRFKIGETLFEARLLPPVCGRLYVRTSECLWQSLERMFSDHHFGILTCETACLGLFKYCGAYYICDVNSFGPPLFHYGHGVAYLMRATSFYKFITVLVLTIGSPEYSQFSLNPVEILRVIEVDPVFDFRAKMDERRNCFGRLVGKKRAFDKQKKRKIKKT